MKAGTFSKLILLFVTLQTAFSPAVARSDAAKALIKELKIETHSVTRKDDNFYDTYEGFVVKTKYCYVYAFSEDAVITDDKIIFIDSDDVCDVEGIYRK